jgi:GAF domain-containing protein
MTSPSTHPPSGREQELVRAFVRLADTLVADFDVFELFHALCADCVELIGAHAAGLLLSDRRGTLRVVSASTEAAHLVELVQLQVDQGPCLDSFRTSGQVICEELAREPRWPQFTTCATEQGFAAVHALPMRLRGTTIGALNLFHREPRVLPAGELAIAQALADVATIAILSDRGTREQEALTGQLQTALTSRIIVEQAKGVLAERGHMGLDDAFARLRAHARATQQRMTDLARAVVDGTYDTDHLL